jgi:hypothetical protein
MYDMHNQFIDDEITIDQFINKTKELGIYDQMIIDFNKCETDDINTYIIECVTDFIDSI